MPFPLPYTLLRGHMLSLSYSKWIERDLFKSSVCQPIKKRCLHLAVSLHSCCQISFLTNSPGEDGKQRPKSNLGGSSGSYWVWLLRVKGASSPPLTSGFPTLKSNALRGFLFVICSMCGNVYEMSTAASRPWRVGMPVLETDQTGPSPPLGTDSSLSAHIAQHVLSQRPFCAHWCLRWFSNHRRGKISLYEMHHCHPLMPQFCHGLRQR